MKIKNANLAGVTVAFKSGAVTGDEQGVFEVPDAEADALLANSKVWTAAKGAKPLPKADDLGDEVDAAVDAVTAPEPDSEPPTVDLDGLTKAGLIEFAEGAGIEVDPTALKSEIRDAIEAALSEGD